MLTAYFDDSGTHDSSDVVLWSGLCGNEHQWAYFSDLWNQKLFNPSPGKPSLSRFHMAECQDSRGEFAGWSRTATDFLVHELGGFVMRAGLWSCCEAVSRKDWDELVVGDVMRSAWGDAEEHCIIGCFSKATQWAQENCHAQMAFVFDNRPHRNFFVKKMYDIYRRGHATKGVTPTLESVTFVTSERFPPLQAADLLAWEHYQFAKDAIKDGIKRPRRKQLARLANKDKMFMRLVDKKEITRMLTSQYAAPETVAEVARAMKMDFR